MSKYAKYVIEAIVLIALFTVLIFFLIYIPSKDSIQEDTIQENNAYSSQCVMTEVNPQFEEIINKMRQMDPEEFDEVYDKFKEQAKANTFE